MLLFSVDGPPRDRKAPLGGSEAHEVASVGGVVDGPPRDRKADTGGQIVDVFESYGRTDLDGSVASSTPASAMQKASTCIPASCSPSTTTPTDAALMGSKTVNTPA